MPKVILTKEGLEKLKTEYQDLIENQRPVVIEELKRSRELGDLSENGAYHAAREKQSFIEGRIQELENLFKNIEVVDSKIKGVVSLGSHVKLKLASKASAKAIEVEYLIVGHGESDIKAGKVAHDSPLGEALMGKKKNESIIVQAPSGNIEYTILEIN